MPTKAPVAPVYAAPFNWTGFYIGAHVGAGWSTEEWIANHNLNGFLGGAQIGYNWQSGWVVFGVEADASWADIKVSSGCLEFECRSKIERARDDHRPVRRGC